MAMAEENTEKVECPKCSGTGQCNPQFKTVEELYAWLLKQPKGDWSPGWYYNEAGDQIEIYWENRPTTSSFIDGGIILHKDMDNKDKVVGVTITNILGRIALNACAETRCKPRPIEPLKCPICGTKPQKVNSHLGDMLYSKDPIECHSCGTTYNEHNGDKSAKEDDDTSSQ